MEGLGQVELPVQRTHTPDPITYPDTHWHWLFKNICLIPQVMQAPKEFRVDPAGQMHPWLFRSYILGAKQLMQLPLLSWLY